MKTLKGSCFCGGVTYEISGPLEGVRNCHCSDCRKMHGAAFRTRASVKKSDFRITKGETLIHEFIPKENEARRFCSKCGSPIYTHFDNAEYIGFPLGSLDDDPEIDVTMHIFVSDKAPWHHINDDLPQFPEFPE